MEIVKTFLFITFSPFFLPLISVATDSGLGICNGKDGICCDGYYEEHGTCKVCPGGLYGKNCTRKCPKNSYGELCRGKCKCTTEETCDPTKGCFPRAICTGSDGKDGICCDGYYEENGTCKVCPGGLYGKNCTQNCPKNSYGELCRGKCKCTTEETCNPSKGCVPRGVCTGSDGKFKCCNNYYQSFKEKCTVCFPGTYGFNCSELCPNGTYGYRCREICNCSPGITCDKQFGCIDQESSEPYKRYQFEILIYTLTPVISAIIFCLMIFFVGKYIQQKFRQRKSSTKNFVDIPPYDISKHRMHHSIDNPQNTSCNKTETESYSTIKTEADETKLSAFSQEETFDDGLYNKLTLRVTGYEEPVARKQLTRRYSDSSWTYMKSSDLNLRRTEEVHNPFQKHRRFSSLRIKNIHKENTGGEMNHLHAMEAGERNVCLSSTTSEECFPLALDGEYVYDMAKFEERNETVGLNQRLLFLKELSSHLLNQKNNIKKNMEIPE